ncbi:MAG: hypothetical protein JRI23_04490 [Deltaproteobacteria bacterium]|jgi:hypothetical protein|nr:hypothetical protein [Deltaproteobacteria bacterium]MBW2530802.1 hypothetical protein [Deltaproteobacteria bacterium]
MTLAKLFQNLDAWRHFPAYRLEPRADPFFSLYIPKAVAERVGVALHDVVIPELPLRRGTLDRKERDESNPRYSPNASAKVDYALFSADTRQVFLVELKTDMASRRDKQDADLEKAKDEKVGFAAIVDGIIKIVHASPFEYLPKYVHLLQALERLGYVKVPPTVYERAFSDQKRGLTAALKEVENLLLLQRDRAPTTEVLYVQPKRDENKDQGKQIIDFEQLAAIAARAADGIGPIFADHLRRWRTVAGSTPPASM